MAAPIGPGDFIEFCDTNARHWRDGEVAAGGYRIVGSYYLGMVTVCEGVTPRMSLPDGRIVPGLRTRAVKAYKGDVEVWLPAYQWRPIYRPRADLIQTLLAPVDAEPVHVTEAA